MGCAASNALFRMRASYMNGLAAHHGTENSMVRALKRNPPIHTSRVSHVIVRIRQHSCLLTISQRPAFRVAQDRTEFLRQRRSPVV